MNLCPSLCHAIHLHASLQYFAILQPVQVIMRWEKGLLHDQQSPVLLPAGRSMVGGVLILLFPHFFKI